MKRGKTNYIYFVILIFFMLVASGMFAQTSDIGIIPKKTFLWFGNDKNEALNEAAQPIVQVPPICGKKRRKLNQDLPLPFGTGVSFDYFKQYYDATNLQLVNDSIGIAASGMANVQKSSSREMKMTFRPDVWVLPFLNIYGITGYSRSTTIPSFEVPQITIKDIPNVGDIVINDTVRIEDELISMGPVYGGGINISTGFKSFFFVADYHYTVAVSNDFNQRFESHALAAKAGILLGTNAKKTKGSFWIGTMFFDDTHTFTGEVDIKEVFPEIEDLPIIDILFGEKATYSGKLTPKKKWNLVAGASITINKHHLFAIEVGYFDSEQLSLFYGFRF